MDLATTLSLAGQWLTDPRVYGPAAASALTALASAAFAYMRRRRSVAQSVEKYFTDPSLLSPPCRRPAYSDRMAHVLSELSDIAYYEFEGPGGLVTDAVQRATALNPGDATSMKQFLDRFSTELMTGRKSSTEYLRTLLKHAGFELLATIDEGGTQAIVCKRVVDEPYVVVAFRGTEKKVDDWLTDARAAPTDLGDDGKVHGGFWQAFTGQVEDRLRAALASEAAQDATGQPLPLFITGHSLGGALALIATRRLLPDINGACYTFGAPRVADYAFFKRLKTPVYRVVNSSDIVPRVPPGAGTKLAIASLQGLQWITALVPPLPSLLRWAELQLDRLNGYRHHGDVRYLTDVAAGQFHEVRLLSNPPAIDRVIWLWEHIAASGALVPVKSHGMRIYRRKLQQIAQRRQAR